MIERRIFCSSLTRRKSVTNLSIIACFLVVYRNHEKTHYQLNSFLGEGIFGKHWRRYILQVVGYNCRPCHLLVARCSGGEAFLFRVFFWLNGRNVLCVFLGTYDYFMTSRYRSRMFGWIAKLKKSIWEYRNPSCFHVSNF